MPWARERAMRCGVTMVWGKGLILGTLLMVFGAGRLPGQEPVFRAPLDIPLSLSGNFMELRSSHFHSGLDLRTDGREGLEVKAAADGWVSRVKVSPWGYGKALYIEHPNGYTTVYGHLRNYSGAIADAVLEAQYKAEHFDLDVTFKPEELPVKAGQLVAISGNSGGSSGPHLHFEVRRTSDQHALDPERYGMDVPDSVAPTFLGLRVDPLDSTGLVAPYGGRARGYPAAGDKGIYALKEGMRPRAFGTVGLSVHVIDRYSNSWSTCGIRRLSVTVDGERIFSARLDEVDFDKQRYADAYMDHALFKENEMLYNRCYKLPNNRLAIYGEERAGGRIRMEPGEMKNVLVEAVDANGNVSKLSFTLEGVTSEAASKWPRDQHTGQLFRHGEENTITTEGFRFTLPANSLYADEHIDLRALRTDGALAGTYRLHDPLTPMYLYGELGLRIREGSADGREDKLLVVKLDDKGRPSPLGGTVANGWITARTRAFGDFTVMIDTVPPKISAINVRSVMTGRDSLIFEVGDNLSGVERWKALLDGRWILLEYDPKKKRLFHRFDTHSNGAGEHQLTVEVSDERGNSSSFRTSFVR